MATWLQGAAQNFEVALAVGCADHEVKHGAIVPGVVATVEVMDADVRLDPADLRSGAAKLRSGVGKRGRRDVRDREDGGMQGCVFGAGGSGGRSAG